MARVIHAYSATQANGTETNKLRPMDWNADHQITMIDGVSLAGNTSGTLTQISSGTMILMGGNNVTLSQQGQSVAILAGGGIALSAGGSLFNAGTVTLEGQKWISSVTGTEWANVIPAVSNGSLLLRAEPTFINENWLVWGFQHTTTPDGPILEAIRYDSDLSDFRAIDIEFRLDSGPFNQSAIFLAQTDENIHTIAVWDHLPKLGMSNLGNTAGTTGIVQNGNAALLLAGGNNVTLSQSINGSNATVSIHAAAGGGGVAISAAGSSQSSGTVVLSGSNNLSFGMNGSTITGIVRPEFTQTASATLGRSDSNDIPTIRFVQSDSLWDVGVPVGGALSHAYINFATFSGTNPYHYIPYYEDMPMIGMSTLGNTAGTTGLISNNRAQLVFVGGNNITLSQSVSTEVGMYSRASQTITISAANGSVTLGVSTSAPYMRSGLVVGSNAQLIFLAGHGMNLSMSNENTTASYNTLIISAEHQWNESLGVSTGGNTAGATQVVSFQRMVLAGGNNITLSQTNDGGGGGSFTVSIIGAAGGAAFSGGVSTFGNTAGSTGTVSNQMVLVGSNNITLSQSSGAGGATVSIIGAAGGGGAMYFTLAGNTSNQSTLSGSTISIAGGNNITLSGAAGAFTISGISVPSTSAQAMDVASVTSGGTNTSRYAMADHQHRGLFNFQISGNTSNTSNTVVGSLVLAGGNNITLSQVSAAGAATITISGPNTHAQQTGISAISAGAASQSSGTIIFSNSNGISFGLNAGTITASHNGLTAALQGIQFTGGETGLTYSLTSGTVRFYNDGGSADMPAVTNRIPNVQFYTDTYGGSTVVKGMVFIQELVNDYYLLFGRSDINSAPYLGVNRSNSQMLLNFNMSGGSANQRYALRSLPDNTERTIAIWNDMPTMGVSTHGNTAGSTGMITGAGQSLLLVGSNNITLSQSSNASGATVSIIGGAGGAAGTNTLGMSNLGNTLGTTGVVTGSAIQYVFAGGSNVTLSQSINGSSGTVTFIAGADMNLTITAGNNITLSSSSNSNSATLTISNLLSTTNSAWGVASDNAPGTLSSRFAMADHQHAGIGSISLGGNTAGATSAGAGSLVLVGGNNITLSATTGAGSLVVSIVGGGGGGGAAISAQGASASDGTVVFSNSNNVSFGMAGSTVTATATFAQTTQAMSFTLGGNTAGQSTLTGSQITLAGGNNITLSGGPGGVTVSAENLQTFLAGLAAGTQTATSGTIVLSNSNNVSFGLSGSTRVTASASYSAETFVGGIAGGTQTATSGTIVFSNSNNVSFGLSGSTRMTASASYSAETFVGGIAGGTQTATSGTIVFSNSNNVSFGLSGSTRMTASFSESVQAMSFTLGGNTAGQSTLTGSQITLVGGNNITLSGGAGVITISAGAGGGGLSAGMSNIGNTSGNTGIVSDRLVLAGGNLVTLSGSTNAGSMTITISAGNTASTFAGGMSNLGNTSGTTGIVSQQLVLVGGDNITLIQSVNGQSATVTIDNGEVQQMTEYPPGMWATGSLGIITYGTVSFVPIFLQKQFSASEANIQGSFSLATSTSGTRVGTLTCYIGMYTMNGSTLSLATSGSQSFSFSYTSNASTSRFNGPRRLSIPINLNASPGRYWYGINFRSAGGTGTVSITMMGGLGHTVFSGEWGQATNTSWRVMPALGYWSSSHSAMPGSAAISDVIGSNPRVPWILFRNIGY